MSYTIALSRRAEKEVLALPHPLFLNIQGVVDRLADSPRPKGARKLHGRINNWRIRVGRYRILYSIDDSRRSILIHRVTDRKDVYRL